MPRLLTNKRTGEPRTQTPYEFGYAGERYLMNALKECGFAATRSAASHGPWDVCAVRDDIALFVQAKRGATKPTPCDYRTLIELHVPPAGVLKLLVWMPDGLRHGRVLYCADGAGKRPMPDWCASLGWQFGPPPKQTALRF